jgi:PPM family protein phosphatase
MKVEAYGMSNVGMRRLQNEDSYLINDKLRLYVVADGMGGHQGGEFASKLAVSTMEEMVRKLLGGDPEDTQIEGVNTKGADPGGCLKHAIAEAGRRIHQQALYDENLRGMGTTTVAALVMAPSIYIANVGDSRAYLIRHQTIEQVTEDHSLVSEQVRAGVLKAEDAKGHKLKNIITRSVGYQEEVDSDVTVLNPQVGDRILMCSDGLSNLVGDEEILKIVSHEEPPKACETLVREANRRGGDDNITVVILQVDEIT